MNNNIQTNSVPSTKEEKLKAIRKRYYEKHKHRWNTYYKQKREQDREQWLAWNREYYIKNKSKKIKYAKDWQQKHPERVKHNRNEYRAKNKESIAKQQKEWNKNNVEHRRAKRKEYYKKRKQNPLFRAMQALRGSVTSAFKRIQQNKPAKTETILGCSWLEAKEHIENLWTEGMSWENYGTGSNSWQIDHIKPVKQFDETTMHLMNHITNLQPLWTKDNLSKRFL